MNLDFTDMLGFPANGDVGFPTTASGSGPKQLDQGW